jgi:hypothetical protein
MSLAISMTGLIHEAMTYCSTLLTKLDDTGLDTGISY